MRVVGEDQDILVVAVQDLSSARTLDRITEIVRSVARRIANAAGATFVLRDGDLCHYVDEDAISPLWKGLKFPMEACVSGWAMRHGQVVSIPDIELDPRVPIAVYRPTFVRSLLMVPIRPAAPIGAIGVYWAEKRTPTSHEIELLAGLANATSVAMENVELHDRLNRKIEELERASRLKNQFLLMLSHELRTPMNSILGWSEALREQASELPEEVRDGLDSIHRNARTEMRLIADLLDSSQVLAGRLALSRSHLDLNEVLEAAAHSIQAQLMAKSIRLNLKLPEDVAIIDGDPDRLAQIIGNLLSNSAKFTPAGGVIELALENTHAGYVITVTDNGEGIQPSLLPNIFDRFQSQTAPLTRRHGGLGLGLSIVKSLVEAHGGSVHASSDGPGRGARFEVCLPRPSAVARPDREHSDQVCASVR